MKNTFYFTSKAFFVLKILSFFFFTFCLVAKRLDEKDKINFKVYDLSDWYTIAIYILLNIVRNKDNRAIKFGQLREYNTKNIFLENPYTKLGGETSPGPFSKKLKLSISLDQQSEFLFSSFYWISKWMTITMYQN